MATFSYEVSPYRRADGTHLIKIRMIHNREVIRKPTAIYVTREQLSRDLSKVRDAAVIDALNRHIDRLRKAVTEIDGAEWYTAAALWDAVNALASENKGFRLDLFAFADTVTATMERGTAEGYKYALNAFRKYLGRGSIDINEITYPLLSGFREWQERRTGKGSRAVSRYLACLQRIHNAARERYNDDDAGLVRIPRQPFRKGLIPPQPTTKPRALTVAQLRAVAASEPTTRRGKLAKDVFMLSFALIGINTADLYGLRKGDLKGGVLTYNRVKSDSRRADRAEMRVRAENKAVEVMERWKGSGGRLLSFSALYADFRTFNANVNDGLKEVGRLAGVDGLTTYYARHTWATIARNECGVDFDTVHEALNHARRGAERVTDIYLARDWRRVWEANRKVLDFVFGEGWK